MTLNYDAVLLLGFGGPEGEDDVLPFLERVTAGRGIPPERLRVVGQHYFTLGGVSPVNEQNRRLRTALATALAARGVDLPVALANRNSAPLIPDVLAELAASGHRTVLAVATAAYSGYSSCRQYREDLSAGLTAAGVDLDIRKLLPYYDLPGFVETIVTELIDALPPELDLAADGTRLVFSTHSIPVAMAATAGPHGDAYLEQHRWVAQRVVAELAARTGVTKPWQLVFQSRSGPPSMPWLEPDVNDALAELADDDAQAVILVPIGFISDHMEVVWDLDTEAKASAARLGLRLIRTPTVGVSKRFVSGLADRIEAELRTGGSLPDADSLCTAGCCTNPRRPLPSVPGTGTPTVEE